MLGNIVKQANFKEQVRRNAVALISLFIALTGLLYNTWRNEHTENNRNQRWASFEVLLMLGELQELVYISYYDPDQSDESDFRRGWAKVLTIHDLSSVLADPLPASATELHAVWGKNWVGLQNRQKENKEKIEEAINNLRKSTLMTLTDLNQGRLVAKIQADDDGIVI